MTVIEQFARVEIALFEFDPLPFGVLSAAGAIGARKVREEIVEAMILLYDNDDVLDVFSNRA
jgi:hypothetical protein